MKLTNAIRDAFIRGVMNDVPHEDYDTQIRDLVMKKAVERLPKPAQVLWKDPATREYLATGRIYFKYKCIDDLPGVSDWGKWIGDEPPKEWFEDINALQKLEDAQKEKLEAVEAKVRAVAYSCTTRKALLDALPEFEKYLPAEAPKGTGLPAVANLVKDLVELGWPDGGKPKTQETTAA